MSFKIGDKVKSIKTISYCNGLLVDLVNAKGFIVKVSDFSKPFLVQFKGITNLHTGDNYSMYDDCYWFDESELELVSPSEFYSVGDLCTTNDGRVICLYFEKHDSWLAKEEYSNNLPKEERTFAIWKKDIIGKLVPFMDKGRELAFKENADFETLESKNIYIQLIDKSQALQREIKTRQEELNNIRSLQLKFYDMTPMSKAKKSSKKVK